MFRRSSRTRPRCWPWAKVSCRRRAPCLTSPTACSWTSTPPSAATTCSATAPRSARSPPSPPRTTSTRCTTRWPSSRKPSASKKCWPRRLSPIRDGAAAIVLCNAEGLKRLKNASARAIRVLASVVQTGSSRSLDEPHKIVAHLAAKKAYEIAGVAPSDVDVAEVHDASAIGEILNAESLMLVPFGEGGPAAERGDFTVGGRMPINPSGGLESKGHPIGATGLGQLHELVTQLRGEAGARQVQGARIAAHENGGGLFGIEEAVVAVTLLARQ